MTLSARIGKIVRCIFEMETDKVTKMKAASVVRNTPSVFDLCAMTFHNFHNLDKFVVFGDLYRSKLMVISDFDSCFLHGNI